MTDASLTIAKGRKPPSATSVRYARQWRRAMRDEVQARQEYLAADEPRAKERARKRWMSTRNHFATFRKLPGDEALALVRQGDRSDQ
jgi:hypothetical protein